MPPASDGREAPPLGVGPGGGAPSARRRPGYPLVGLRARRVRLRFTRRGQGSVLLRGVQGRGYGREGVAAPVVKVEGLPRADEDREGRQAGLGRSEATG